MSRLSPFNIGNFAAWSDVIIMLVLGVIPLAIVFLCVRAKKKTKPAPIFLGVALTCVWCVIFWGSFIQPKILTVKPYAIDLDTGTRTLRIALISDLHLGPYKGAEWSAKVAARINTLSPDLVIIDGDIVTIPAGIDELAPLKNIRAKFGVYAILGNWDYRVGAVDVRKQLGSYGIKMLVNRSVPIDVPIDLPSANGQKSIRLIGMDDYWFGKPDWKKALAEVPADAVTLVAVHNPDIIGEAELRGIDLVLAGHTHGGQIRLPWIGAVPQISLVYGNRFDHGLFTVGRTRLFITPGVGESGARARLFSTPEISFVTLTL